MSASKVNFELVKRGLRPGAIIDTIQLSDDDDVSVNDIINSDLFYNIEIRKPRKISSVIAYISHREFRKPKTDEEHVNFLGYYKYIEDWNPDDKDKYNGYILYKNREVLNSVYPASEINLDDFSDWLAKETDKFNKGFEEEFTWKIELIKVGSRRKLKNV